MLALAAAVAAVAIIHVAAADLGLGLVGLISMGVLAAWIVIRRRGRRIMRPGADRSPGERPGVSLPRPTSSGPPSRRPTDRQVSADDTLAEPREVGSACGRVATSVGASEAIPLAATLDRSRRLGSAEQRVADELAGLPAECWLVERYVLVGAHRLTFLIVGSSGLVALAATDGAWTVWDLAVLNRIGHELCGQLPGYRGSLRAAVCLAFDEQVPRRWYGGANEQVKSRDVV